MRSTPAVATTMARREAEDSRLDRLRLDRRRHDGEGALPHGGEHQGRGEDLGERAAGDEEEEGPVRARDRLAEQVRSEENRQEREGEAVEESHLRRPGRSDAFGQAALGGVAGRLGGGSGERRRDPEKGGGHRAIGGSGKVGGVTFPAPRRGSATLLPWYAWKGSVA
jgi:hypothetical protein